MNWYFKKSLFCYPFSTFVRWNDIIVSFVRHIQNFMNVKSKAPFSFMEKRGLFSAFQIIFTFVRSTCFVSIGVPNALQSKRVNVLLEMAPLLSS